MAVYLGSNQIDMFGGNGIVQPTLQTKTINPSESIQNITADSGYDGLDEVIIQGIPLDHVGSGIDQRDSTDLTVNGPTVIAPEGYYGNEATKTIASGSATPAASLTATGASLTTGTNTLTFSKSIQNTPQVSAGYVSSGTAGNSSVSLTANVTTKAAATFTPTTTAQTIAAGTYLTGAQTIAGDPNLIAANILSGKSIFNVAGSAISGLEYEKGDINVNSSYWKTYFSKSHGNNDTIANTSAPDFVYVYPKINTNAFTHIVFLIVNFPKIFNRNGGSPTSSSSYVYWYLGQNNAKMVTYGGFLLDLTGTTWELTTYQMNYQMSEIVSTYLNGSFFRLPFSPPNNYSSYLSTWSGKYEYLAVWVS